MISYIIEQLGIKLFHDHIGEAEANKFSAMLADFSFSLCSIHDVERKYNELKEIGDKFTKEAKHYTVFRDSWSNI